MFDFFIIVFVLALVGFLLALAVSILVDFKKSELRLQKLMQKTGKGVYVNKHTGELIEVTRLNKDTVYIIDRTGGWKLNIAVLHKFYTFLGEI